MAQFALISCYCRQDTSASDLIRFDLFVDMDIWGFVCLFFVKHIQYNTIQYNTDTHVHAHILISMNTRTTPVWFAGAKQ